MAGIIYQYGGPPFSFGSIDAVEPFAFAIYESLDPANLGAHEGLGLLLVASPYNPGTDTSPTIYPAATHGRSTLSTDTPATTWVPHKLQGDINIGVELFSGADPTRKGSQGVGVFQILDPDGELDGLLDLVWDGASIELKRGDPSSPYSEWTTAAKLTAAGMLSNLQEKELRLRDIAWKLTTSELHGERYAGTGTVEGDAPLAGRAKPYCVGYVTNITPVLINATALIYQVSWSSVAAISAVYDGRAALTPGADYANYALLAAATVGGGTYATCKALGLFRLGSSPVLDVTANVTGDADVVNGTPGPTTRAGVVRRIATGIGSVTLSDSEQIDFTSFGAFESQQPAPVGWYWDQPGSKADALDEVLAGCLGYWFVGPNGQLSIGLVDDPTARSADIVLSYPATGAGEVRLGEPQMTDWLSPRRGTHIGWGRNYTIQTRSVLAGSVSDADAQIYAEPTRYASVESATIAAKYPASPTVYLTANYRDEADALTEATRQQALFSVARTRWTVSIVMDPLADVVSQVARIDNLNRLGWGAAKSLLVCGVDANGPSVELKLWG